MTVRFIIPILYSYHAVPGLLSALELFYCFILASLYNSSDNSFLTVTLTKAFREIDVMRLMAGGNYCTTPFSIEIS